MSAAGPSVLIACDTTRRVNWGARSSSLALQQSLTRRFSDVRTLPGEHAEQWVSIDTVLPPSLAAPLLARRHRNLLLGAYHRFETLFGMKPDYIDIDPAKSAANILANRDRDTIRDVYAAVSKADVVVVDGDGDLIFRTPPGRIPLFNLAVIEVASSLGKNVHYVNSIFSDCPRTGRNEAFHRHALSTLSKCATVLLRDPESMRLARASAPDLSIEFAPDTLFLWYDALQDAAASLPDNGDYLIPFGQERADHYGRIRFDEPYACLSGSSHAAFFQDKAVDAYSALATRLRERLGMTLYLAPTCHGDRFLYDVAARTSLPLLPPQIPIMMAAAVLAKAEVYVTGRYHPAIMAGLGGTPCVFLGADSHKTASLQELLGYQPVRLFPALPGRSERDQICEVAAEHLRRGNEIRDSIRRAARDRFLEAQKLPEIIARNMPSRFR